MFSNHLHFSAILFFLALGFLVTIVTGAVTPTPGDTGRVIDNFAGNKKYSATVEELELDEGNVVTAFTVFSDDYTEEDAQGNIKPSGIASVDALYIDTDIKRLTIMRAMNGNDKTRPRLSMRQVMLECWDIAGLVPSEIKQVFGAQVENKNMMAALEKCRSKDVLNIGASDGFVLTLAELEALPKKKMCWQIMENTVFGSSIKGVGEFFGEGKKIIEIRVDNYIAGTSDDILYQFNDIV